MNDCIGGGAKSQRNTHTFRLREFVLALPKTGESRWLSPVSKSF
jgi:hypothetical protein